MPQYLVANYLPDDFDPSAVTEAMIEEIHALNREMIAAGARKFACGISPASNAKTVRKQPDGTVLVTDGPYTETKEHMGGFWILEAADMDEALAWARKGAICMRCGGRGARASFLPGTGTGPVEKRFRAGDRPDAVLEERQGGNDRRSLCGNQGTTRRHSRP
jgi:hypothetical protein